MRNLKRALSLALASVMLFGMMVVGAGAASYPDVDEETHNIEAIDVLQAVEVMVGDEGTGNFRPDDEVSRAEMAVIMAKLLNLDYDYYEAIPSSFTDVTGNYDWARGWINACAANGIVSGRGNGIYDPAAGVTAVEAASMMMRALGYFQNSGDYNGGFEAATVRQASRINLFSGINGNANDALDRNQVAQLALNTLEARMVDFTGDMGFDYNGLSVGYRSEYEYRTATQDRYNAIEESGFTTNVNTNGQEQYYVQLGEQLYNGDLKKSTSVDGFQAPATRWSYKNDEIGLYTWDHDYVLEGTVKSREMYATVGKTVAEQYDWYVYMDGGEDNLTGDDDLFDGDKVSANNSDDLAGTGNGTYTYVYLLQDSTGASDGDAIVTIINTYAAEVTKVEDGKITLSDDSLTFEIDGCAEDDVVLYTKYIDSNGDWTVANVLGLAELVEGEATTVRDQKYVVVDGTQYNYNATFTDYISIDSAGANVAVYLDLQGNIAYVGEAEELSDYALVLSVGRADSKFNANEAEYGAQLILSDGTVRDVSLDKDTTSKIPGLLSKSAYTGDDPQIKIVWDALVGRVFRYDENSNGTFNLTGGIGDDTENYVMYTAAKDTQVIKNGRSSIITDDGRLYANNSTVFVLNDLSDDGDDFATCVGYQNVPDVTAGEDTVVSAYVNDKGIARVVFVQKADVEGAGGVIFVVGADARENKNNSGETYKVYDAIVDGEVTTISVKTNNNYEAVKSMLAKNKIGVFSRITVDGDGYVTKLTPLADDAKYEKPTDYHGTQKLTGAVYGFGYNEADSSYKDHIGPSDKTVIGYLSESGDLSVASNLKTDKNDVATVILNKDGELIGIFVQEVDDKEGVYTDSYAVTVKDVDDADITVTYKDGEETKSITSAEAVKVPENTELTISAALKSDADQDAEGVTLTVNGKDTGESSLTYKVTEAVEISADVSYNRTHNLTITTDEYVKVVVEYTDADGASKTATVNAGGEDATIKVKEGSVTVTADTDEDGTIVITVTDENGSEETIEPGDSYEVKGDVTIAAELKGDVLTVKSTKTGDDAIKLAVVEEAPDETTVAEDLEWLDSIETCYAGDIIVAKAAAEGVTLSDIDTIMGEDYSDVTTAASVQSPVVTADGVSVVSFTMPKQSVIITEVSNDAVHVEKGYLDIYSDEDPALNLLLKSGDTSLSAGDTANKTRTANAAVKWLKANGYEDAAVVTTSGGMGGSSITGVKAGEYTIDIDDITGETNLGYATVKAGDVEVEVVADAQFSGTKFSAVLKLVGVTKMEDNDTIDSSDRWLIITAEDGETITYKNPKDTDTANGDTIDIGAIVEGESDKATGYVEITIALDGDDDNLADEDDGTGNATVSEITAVVIGPDGEEYEDEDTVYIIPGATLTIEATATLEVGLACSGGVQVTPDVAESENKLTVVSSDPEDCVLIPDDTDEVEEEDAEFTLTIVITIDAEDASSDPMVDDVLTITFEAVGAG